MKIKKIFIDMDGVLADFDKWMEQNEITSENLWEEAKKVDHLYFNLDPMPEYKELMEYLRSLDVPLAILTALPRKDTMPDAKSDKRKWIAKYIGDIEFNVGPYAVNKQRFSGPGLVLIDDKQRNIDQWNSKGGIGIRYTNLEALKKSIERVMKRNEENENG